MMYIRNSSVYYALSVILLVLSCDGCYTNYNNCQQQYFTAASSAGSSDPTLAQQQLCGAATTAMTCLDNDAANCAPRTVEPAGFTQIKTSINQTVINCEITNSCFRKVSVCANYSTEITDIVMSTNFTDPSSLQSLSSMMCPTFDKITKCYSELTLMCLDPAFANATVSLDAVKPLIAQICGNARGTQNGCLQKSLECRSISQKILSINFSDTPVCTAMTNVTTCYNRLKEDCPNLTPAELTSHVDAMKPMLDQMCGAGENCLGCVTPVMDFDCQNTSKEDYEGIYRCCVVSYEMFNCLKRNQCTQMPTFGDIQLFQSAVDRQCTGYQEYCPGLNGCLSSFNTNPDLYTVCPQISSFMTCVNTACKDKPKVGNLTIMKIMPLYQQICTGLSNYPAIATCQTFDRCTKNGVTALIPQPITLKSISAVGNPEHWCKMAKGISKCVSAAPKPCMLAGNIVADAAAIKRSTDEICIGVRDPCPGVAVCLTTLGSGGSQLQSCFNTSAFITCVTTALNACGESSKVKANYSLADIQNLFTQSCTVFPNFASCQQTSICTQIDLPSSVSEITDKVSDQTFWCNSLKSILKCTTAYSQPCNQTTTVTQTLNNLLNQVKVHCPDEGDVEEITTVVTTGGGNAGISVESSLMLILVVSSVVSFD